MPCFYIVTVSGLWAATTTQHKLIGLKQQKCLSSQHVMKVTLLLELLEEIPAVFSSFWQIQAICLRFDFSMQASLASNSLKLSIAKTNLWHHTFPGQSSVVIIQPSSFCVSLICACILPNTLLCCYQEASHHTHAFEHLVLICTTLGEVTPYDRGKQQAVDLEGCTQFWSWLTLSAFCLLSLGQGDSHLMFPPQQSALFLTSSPSPPQ